MVISFKDANLQMFAKIRARDRKCTSASLQAKKDLRQLYLLMNHANVQEPWELIGMSKPLGVLDTGDPLENDGV